MAKNYRCDICRNIFTNLIDLNYHWLFCGQKNQEDKDYEWLKKEVANMPSLRKKLTTQDISSPPTPSRPKKAAKPRNSSTGYAAPSGERQLPHIETIRVKHKLVLGDKQKVQLEGLFMAPKALAALLRAYPQKVVTPADASVFLLRNRKELDSYINSDARGRAVDLLTELLLQWSGNPPDSIGIDFDDVSLAPDQKVYLPLDGLRSVEVADPMELLRQRKDRRFKKPFTLFEENKQFFVALTLEPKVPSRPTEQIFTQSIQINKPQEVKRRKIKTPEIQLIPGQPLPYISGMRNQPKEPRQRVLFSKYSGVFSGGIKTMNWGGLSGWGVNGGLPSLGKRSR